MTDETRTKLVALLDRAEQAEAAVANGDPGALEGFDREVAALCAEVRALPKADGRALRDDLEELLASVDRLHAEMQKQHDAMKGELDEHGRRSQATRAYGQRALRGGPGT